MARRKDSPQKEAMREIFLLRFLCKLFKRQPLSGFIAVYKM